jgi:hypothetical protein
MREKREEKSARLIEIREMKRRRGRLRSRRTEENRALRRRGSLGAAMLYRSGSR